jgi:hypothetical protein
MMNSKSSEVRTDCILVMVDFDFFREEGFGGGGRGGGTFLFFNGSTLSLGNVTSLGLYSASTSSL